MDYRHKGNDPQAHKYMSPAEVKALLTGGSNGQDCRQAESLADLGEALGCRQISGTPKEVAAEVMVWLTGERTMDESRALARREGRCWPCGREFDCCCQGCPICPQSKMEEGKISAAHAKRQVALGDTDPREMR